MVRRFITGILGLALPAGFAVAQAKPADVPTFVSEVRVNNITVDVQVHDDKGVPVSGLKKEDFTLLENDKAQPLTNFSVIEGGKVSLSQDPALVGQPAPRQVVLFFDLYLMLEQDKQSALESLRSFVEPGITPGVTFAVVSFDGVLRIHTPPTASRDKVLEALKAVERQPATGLQRQVRLSQFEAAAPPRETWTHYNYRKTQNEEYWNELKQMTGRVESAFAATVQRFSETRSRKIVIMVSPGFPRAENIPIYRDYDYFYDGPPEFRMVGLYGRAAYLASDLEYTLYALDPTSSQYGDAASAVDVSYRQPPQVNDVADVRFWREADRKDNLTRMAEITGGEAIFSRDVSGALSDVDRLTASYYSLGFQPDHAGDGKQYKLKVTVVGHPEYTLVYRASYMDRPFEDRDAERSRAALLTGDTANPIGLMLVLDKPQGRFKFGAGKMKAFRVAAELRIPFEKLTMLPRGDQAWGEVLIVIVGVDEVGNQSELSHQKVPIQIPAEKLAEARQRGYYAYRFTLELEGGTTSVRIGVSDAISHLSSSVFADIKL